MERLGNACASLDNSIRVIASGVTTYEQVGHALRCFADVEIMWNNLPDVGGVEELTRAAISRALSVLYQPDMLPHVTRALTEHADWKVRYAAAVLPRFLRDRHAGTTLLEAMWNERDTSCNYYGDRALIFDQKVMWMFNKEEFDNVPIGELIHSSVGVKIQKSNRFLLFRRTLHPVGKYTIPAGHLEQGEDPQKFAITEAYEETGLGIVSCELALDNKVIKEPCRRSVDYHVWKLYTCECIGDPKMSYEADIIGWYTLNEIRDLPLTTPTREFFLGSP